MSVEQWRQPELETLDKDQAAQVVTSASLGLTAYRGAQLWAVKIDEYRKSGISLVHSVAAILLLVLQAVATFAIANAGLYHVAPEQFSGPSTPDAGIWVYYAFSSRYLNTRPCRRQADTQLH